MTTPGRLAPTKMDCLCGETADIADAPQAVPEGAVSPSALASTKAGLGPSAVVAITF